MTIDANGTDPDDNASAISWVRRSWDDLNNRFGTGSAYLNFEGREGDTSEEDGAGAVAANLGRLAEVKAKYDPDNFFRRNNNIAPTI